MGGGGFSAWGTQRVRPALSLTLLDYTVKRSTQNKWEKEGVMYRKTVITGGIVEVTEYQILNVVGKGGHRPGIGTCSEENYKKHQRTRKNRVRQLVATNFDKGSKFHTFTFADTEDFDVRDVQQCNAEFRKFILRLRRRYKGFNYIAVIEFQDRNGRGAVHYHMISDLPFIEHSKMMELWGLGGVRVNRIKHVDNVGAYVVKYMVKDIQDERLRGEQAYLRSRGLQEPIEVCSWRLEDKEVLDDVSNLLKEKSPSYYSEYESEHAGLIKYYQYNMNSNKK